MTMCGFKYQFCFPVSTSAPGVPGSSHRSDERGSVCAQTDAVSVNREPNSLASSVCVLDSIPSRHDSDAEVQANPRKKLRYKSKLNVVETNSLF